MRSSAMVRKKLLPPTISASLLDRTQNRLGRDRLANDRRVDRGNLRHKGEIRAQVHHALNRDLAVTSALSSSPIRYQVSESSRLR